MDPVLKYNKKEYLRFVARLLDNGVVDLGRTMQEKVGAFCVKKKQAGRLRLVIDARRANGWWKKPGHVSLATGTALSQIQIPEGTQTSGVMKKS